MNWWILLFAAAIIISIIRYAGEALALKDKLIFISLRSAQALLILVAFFEPVFHFQRVLPETKTIPVLIDASRSMSLFQPESTVLPFLNKLQYINNLIDTKSKKYQFFLFGDSLRSITNLNELKFLDNLSEFPTTHKKFTSSSHELIIVSDANWSNSVTSDFFSNKTIRYLQLPSFRPHPYLRILNSEFSSSHADSLSLLYLTIEGRIEENKEVRVTVMENGKSISEQILNEPPGYFKRTLNIKLPATAPGKHLYRLKAVCSDSLYANAYAVRDVAPGNFIYQIHSSFPTLDLRFLSLSLSKHQEFHRNEKVKHSKNDCLFFFHWNDTIAKALESLKPNGIAVFIGSLPCSKPQSVTPQPAPYFKTAPADYMTVNDLILQKLPPPSKFMSCPELPLIIPFLSISQQQNGTKDTAHILFSSEWKGYPALVFAATDFWKLDFWPMSTEHSEEQAFSFSELFISLLKEQLLSRISEQYFLYPAEKAMDTDSIRFSVSFPSTIPVSYKTDIRFSVKDMAEKTVLDTTMKIINTGSRKQMITIGALRAGNYTFSSTSAFKNKRYFFSDSLHIGRQDRELQISGQNTLLLSETGQPLNADDSMALVQNLMADNAGKELFIEDSIQLNRSWWLLIMLLALLTTEWIYRRSKLLD